MRKLAYLMLAMLVTASALAQPATPEPRENLWKQKWVRAAVKDLQNVGLWTNSDVLIDARPPSNYEIAIGVLEAVRRLKQSINDAEAIVKSLEGRREPEVTLNDAHLTLPATLEKIRTLQNHIKIAEKMSAHLMHEISSLGGEAESQISNLPAQRFEIEQVYSRGVLAVARIYGLPNAPKYAYVKDTLRGLKVDGFASNYGGLFAGIGARDYKAQELIACCDDFTKFSGMAKSLIANLKSQLKEKPLPSEMDQIRQDLIDADSIVDLLAKWSKKRRDLDKTIDFFSEEIKALGRDPNALKKQVRNAL